MTEYQANRQDRTENFTGSVGRRQTESALLKRNPRRPIRRQNPQRPAIRLGLTNSSLKELVACLSWELYQLTSSYLASPAYDQLDWLNLQQGSTVQKNIWIQNNSAFDSAAAVESSVKEGRGQGKWPLEKALTWPCRAEGRPSPPKTPCHRHRVQIAPLFHLLLGQRAASLLMNSLFTSSSARMQTPILRTAQGRIKALHLQRAGTVLV